MGSWDLEDNTIYELIVARFEFESFIPSGNGLNQNIIVNRFIDGDYIKLSNIPPFCISDIIINIMYATNLLSEEEI